MAGLGPYLSRLREERGVSIEELARVTRVGRTYLEALEREDLAVLPAPAFTKGFIRAYCQALEVPVEEALSRYGESINVKVPVAGTVPAAQPADDGRPQRGTLLLSFVLLIGFGAALFVVTLLLQSGRPGIGARPAAPPVATVEPQAKTETARSSVAPATAPEPAATPQPPPPAALPPSPSAATSSPAAATPLPAAPLAPSAEKPPSSPGPVDEPLPLQLAGVVSPYRLVARTVELTWLRVRTEDGRSTEETIPPGEVREWISNRPFIVTIGNAAGVALELNGHKLPPLGERGAVIRRLILPPAEP